MNDVCPLCRKDHGRSFERALAIQAATPRRLERLLAGLRPAQLAQPPAAGKWSIAEIAWHLADCEIVYGFRYRTLLADEAATLPAFDQNRWAVETAYRDRDAAVALESFAALRRANVGLLRAGAARHARTATHPEYGALSLAHLTIHLSAHDENHLAQIRHIRKGAERSAAGPRARTRTRRRRRA